VREQHVISDVRDVLLKWVTVAREVIADLAAFEQKQAVRSKRRRAASRWVIYLGVMIVKAAEGVAAIAPTGNARAMIVLARSMFEYQQKAEFLVKHHREAFDQLDSLPAREYAELTKLQDTPGLDVQIAASYLEWKRTSADKDERSGNRRLSHMHLDNTSEPIKKDKNGTKYTDEYQTQYGIASLYVHGEAMLMPEVFLNTTSQSDWGFVYDRTYAGPLTAVLAALEQIMYFCSKTSKAYSLDESRIQALRDDDERIRKAARTLKGWT
jgi:hypothetical protein